MKYTSVREPRWTNDKKESIECIVNFEKLGELPFHAHPQDSEDHGREIFALCVAGVYGEVGDPIVLTFPATVVDKIDVPPARITMDDLEK